MSFFRFQEGFFNGFIGSGNGGVVPPAVDNLLLEDGSSFLLEDGISLILLE